MQFAHPHAYLQPCLFYQHNHKISKHYLSPTLSKCFSSLNPTTNGIKVLCLVNPTNQPPPLFSTGSVFLNLVALSNSFKRNSQFPSWHWKCFQKIFKLSESDYLTDRQRERLPQTPLPLVLFMHTREWSSMNGIWEKIVWKNSPFEWFLNLSPLYDSIVFTFEFLRSNQMTHCFLILNIPLSAGYPHVQTAITVSPKHICVKAISTHKHISYGIWLISELWSKCKFWAKTTDLMWKLRSLKIDNLW